MGLKHKLLLFIYLLGFILSCTSETNKSTTLKVKSVQEFQFSDSIYIIQIKNSKDYPIKLTLSINDIFPLNYDVFKGEINKLSIEKNISREKSAWMFVSNSTYHSKPLTGENWQHNPLLFLNSIGGGMCDDRASVLAKLWTKQGDSSRIIGLDGHVVPEVFTDGKWKMYDPDYTVFYCNTNGEIQSVKDLETRDGSIFTSQCDTISVNPIFHFNNPITKYITSLYKSKGNNYDVTDWHLNYQEITNEFIIPAHSKIEIAHDKKTNVTSFKVSLTNMSKGELKIPLVPYQANGKMKITSNDTTINVSGKNIILPNNRNYSKMDIISVAKKSEISYLINPKLSFFAANNKIKITSSDSLKIYSATKKENSPKIIFRKEQLFFNQKSIIHKEFLKEIAEYKETTINQGFLKNKYALFLKSDQSLTEVKRSTLTSQFEKECKAMFTSNSKVKLIKEHYPMSVFYLFLASRYQKMNYINEILKNK